MVNDKVKSELKSIENMHVYDINTDLYLMS